jgi:hypothetical protein
MGYIFLLFLVVSCGSPKGTPGYDEEGTKDYLTNGYLCDKMYDTTYTIKAFDCENIMTGSKVPEIINPTNIIPVKG